MALVTRYVNLSSTPGGDGTTNATSGTNRAYASLSEWEAAEQTDLVTAGDVHKVICTGGADSTAVNLTGWTTSTTNYVIIEVDAASRHDGTPLTGYRLTATVDFGSTLNIQQAGTVIKYLEIHNLGTTQNRATTANNADSVEYYGVIAKATSSGTATSTKCFASESAGLTTTYYYNCLAFEGTTYGFHVNDFKKGVYYNCTSVDNGGAGFIRAGTGTGAGVSVAKNCVAYNNGTQFDNGGSSSYWDQTNSSNNATSDATTTAVPGSTGNVASIASSDFTDVANDDYSLASGSSLAEAGTDLTTLWSSRDRTDFTVAEEDIIGTTRPQSTNWDIGAFELVSAGGTPATVTVPFSDIAVAAQVPTVSGQASVTVPATNVAVSALAPTVSGQATVTTPAVGISVATLAPTVSGQATVTTPAVDIAVAILAPSVSAGAVVSPSAIDVNVRALAPSVTGSEVVPVGLLEPRGFLRNVGKMLG